MTRTHTESVQDTYDAAHARLEASTTARILEGCALDRPPAARLDAARTSSNGAVWQHKAAEAAASMLQADLYRRMAEDEDARAERACDDGAALLAAETRLPPADPGRCAAAFVENACANGQALALDDLDGWADLWAAKAEEPGVHDDRAAECAQAARQAYAAVEAARARPAAEAPPASTQQPPP